jgi:hypothetical protein
MASFSPRVIASPDWADEPDSAVTWPILIGSAAKAGPDDPRDSSKNAAATADNPGNLVEFISWKRFIADLPDASSRRFIFVRGRFQLSPFCHARSEMNASTRAERFRFNEVRKYLLCCVTCQARQDFQ